MSWEKIAIQEKDRIIELLRKEIDELHMKIAELQKDCS